MIKALYSLVLLILLCPSGFSQDVITKATGENILAKILEVKPTEIKYKKFDHQNGPTYTILKSEVLMARYENGTKDVFNDANETHRHNPISIDELRMKGKRDSQMHYKGKRSGAGWTAATTIVFSPLLGVIPAAVIASAEPSEQNLNFRDYELMMEYNYNKEYVEQAHKTKKRKVWTSYGVGSGVWLFLVLLL